MKENKQELAIFGGTPVRTKKLPGRKQFDEQVKQAVDEVFEHAWTIDKDPGYREKYYQEYRDSFQIFQGGGYAHPISSGSNAVLIAIMALQLPIGSEILVSPVTDPGSISAIILAQMIPVVVDSESGTYNSNAKTIKSGITSKTKAILLTHVGGIPSEIHPIISLAKDNSILVIEDCSQAHGAEYHQRKVGTFGDIAVFSTMFSKNHSSGGCGGIIYTSSEELNQRVLQLSDRGKDEIIKNYDPKNPNTFTGPGFNMNQDEISCAIGTVTLGRLDSVNKKREEIVGNFRTALNGTGLQIKQNPTHISPAYFFCTVDIDNPRKVKEKLNIAKSIAAEGVAVNPNYCYIVQEWEWAQKYLPTHSKHPVNAIKKRKSSFNILFHEKYEDQEVNDIIKAIIKVAKHFQI